MKFKNCCKGIEAKKSIIKHFRIKPLTYLKLLNDQSKIGCCGKITDKYYVFEYENKHNEFETGHFFTGYSCGEQFLTLLKIKKEKFKLFNPLHDNSHHANYNQRHRYNNGYENMTDTLNQEIYNAINLIFSAWDKIPYSKSKIGQILDFVRRVNIRTKDWAVMEVNELIGKDYHKRTLRDIISQLGTNNNIRDFSFPEMKRIINNFIESGEDIRNNIGE